MLESVQNIVGDFLKIAPAEVSRATRIDRQALKSSIMVHRLYARLSEQGLQVSGYQNINTVGDLLDRLNGAMPQTASVAPAGASSFTMMPGDVSSTLLGVDLEARENFPEVPDFRESEFYTMNFTSAEISHCILQPDPYLSFAGLFAAKEAIIKADQQYRALPFNQIEIAHQPDGKPTHKNFSISIAHAGQMAMAAAVQVMNNLPVAPASTNAVSNPATRSFGLATLIAIVALVMAVIALFFK
jgi:phosphopantetheine--protein transferase-like protein